MRDKYRRQRDFYSRTLIREPPPREPESRLAVPTGSCFMPWSRDKSVDYRLE